MHDRRFDPAHMHRLDSPERRKMLPPDTLLKQLPIEETDSVVDLGAGTGYFTIPAAQRTQGRVIAVDVEPQMLEVIKDKVEENGANNVELVQGAIEDVPLEDETANHVIASLVLHEVEPLQRGLSEIRRLLKDGGHCLCLEWEKTPSEMGPPLHHRIHSSDMKKAFEDAGFTVTKHEAPTPMHYLLVARK